ncbi:MAG: PQQ-binding-like beta-propeller repeat protein [Phycisphaeraceae bacterium]|nr:PQQ-binding-like beta-propeller repeat protein [Phycisphaeraceae bacterium]
MRCCLSLLIVLFTTAPAGAQWSQYLGPNGDLTSPETGLLDSWPVDGPKELWRIDVGPGYGGAAVHNGEVIIHDRVHGEADILRVLDFKTGEEKWRFQYDAAGRVGHEGSRCTPSVTDTHIFTTGQMGDLYAFDRKTKKPAWSVNIIEKYPDDDKSDGQGWGYGMNPLLVGDTVVAASYASEHPGLIAFDQKTGEVVWESEAFGDSSMYSSPLIRTIAGVEGIAVRNIKHLFFIDPKTGKTLFKHQAYSKGKIPITPITVMPDGEHVFVTQGYEMGSVMLKVTRDGNKFNAEEKYRTIEGSQIHPAIPIGEHLYINHGENATHGKAKRKFAGLACVDPATGEVVWNTGEAPFLGRGALLYADGKLIMQDAEAGRLFLVQPSPEGYKPISSFQATDAKQKKAWAPLTLANGLLIVRDQDEMVCFDLRKNVN